LAKLSDADLKKIEGQLSEDENNPWAICTASVGRSDQEKYEQCVLEVKKRLGKASDRARLIFRDSIPGGQYVAIQDSDGTWKITSEDGRGFPIMGSLAKGARGNLADIDGEWMRRTLDRHRELERDNKYLPPVHAQHHGEGNKTSQIGFLRLTGTGKIVDRGAAQDSLMAEVVGVREGDLQAIENLQFPYRSVEVTDWKKNEVASLALLSDDAPFFKLPLMKIGRRIPQEPAAAASSLVALVEADPAAAFLFRASGGPVQDFQEGTVKDKAAQLADGNQDRPGPDKTGQPDQLDAADVVLKAAVAKEIAEWMKQLPDVVKSTLQGLLPTRRPNDTAPAELGAAFQEEPMAQDPKTPETPSPQKLVDQAAHEAIAALSGKVAGLEAAQKTRERREKLSGLVDGQVAALKEAGWHVPEATIKSMREIAEKAGEDGAEACLKAFSESFKATAPKDPKRLEEFEQTAEAAAQQDAPEVVAYQKQGPEAFAEARRLQGQYQQLQDGGMGLSISLKEFLEVEHSAHRKAGRRHTA
jgi:hypothetical protein